MACDGSLIREWLSAYMDDACTDQEKHAVEEHLAVCAECCLELLELQALSVALQEMPDMSLPSDFTQSWQARLAEEQTKTTESPFVAIPLSEVSRKRWKPSRRFAGIAAAVVMCASVSLIGGHINDRYGHFPTNASHQFIISNEQKKTNEAQTMAVAENDRYDGGIAAGLTASQSVREGAVVPSSSRGGNAVTFYLPDNLNGQGVIATADNDENRGVDTISSADVSNKGGAPQEGTNAGSGADTKTVPNGQLYTEAAKKAKAAKNASNWEMYNGYLTLATENVDDVRAKVLSAAARYDGYAGVDAVISEKDGDYIHLEIYVKSEYLQTALADIAGYGKVTAKSINRVDLSEAYYDAQGRLTHQRALEQSLLRLIGESNDVAGIRALEQELGKVTAEIESIIGNLEKISRQRQYAAIVVNITPNAFAGQGDESIGHKLRFGFASFLDFCRTFPDNLLVGFGFMFEVFVVVVLLSFLFYWIMRKLLQKPKPPVNDSVEHNPG